MAKSYRIELDRHDLGQLLEGLEIRADAWRRTAEYLRTGNTPDGELFIIEECGDEEEADEIASYYEAIIGKIRKQMEAQS